MKSNVIGFPMLTKAHLELIVCGGCGRMRQNSETGHWGKWRFHKRREMIEMLLKDGVSIGHSRCNHCKDRRLRK